MKKLRYVSTCAGGKHFKFTDQDTGDTVEFTVEDLDNLKAKAKDIKDENDDLEQNLPAFLKNRPNPNGQGGGSAEVKR